MTEPSQTEPTVINGRKVADLLSISVCIGCGCCWIAANGYDRYCTGHGGACIHPEEAAIVRQFVAADALLSDEAIDAVLLRLFPLDFGHRHEPEHAEWREDLHGALVAAIDAVTEEQPRA